MVVHNYFAIAPYERGDIAEIWSIYYGGVVIASPQHLRWREHGVHTMEVQKPLRYCTYDIWRRPKHGGDRMLAGYTLFVYLKCPLFVGRMYTFVGRIYSFCRSDGHKLQVGCTLFVGRMVINIVGLMYTFCGLAFVSVRTHLLQVGCTHILQVGCKLFYRSDDTYVLKDAHILQVLLRLHYCRLNY